MRHKKHFRKNGNPARQETKKILYNAEASPSFNLVLISPSFNPMVGERDSSPKQQQKGGVSMIRSNYRERF